ncbi:bacillithiol biosynthesis cysteine-adding enzyme BshC [Flavobacterium sp. H122]|uniref:bacillithiol biosynthesis cysteine-adding enzyme BshC n=1 Tax=Flavobacterium sp. H122 TaxID=2529860 RepID=UPI0010AA53C6|nr:bacillithiol biosynthesis cysteine-adding enzyme BshC [Flavobacterium sp. H122]
MPTDCITYQNSGYFSKLIIDYLNQKTELQSLYNRFPSIENFKNQIEEKSIQFSQENRNVLVDSLTKQNNSIEVSETSSHNIELLKHKNTFTITTGHQLNLFTGPLYFIYKIVSVINLCKQLKAEYPDCNFVPIYWMATEDHDFEEINHFKFHNQKILWKKNTSGPVGRIKTKELEAIFEEIKTVFGTNDNAKHLLSLFEEAYLKRDTLTEATRFLVNEFFKNEGLVIIDGDDKNLKKLFVPAIKEELLQQTSFVKVTETISDFKYPIQVNPREINLFYIEDNLRERILCENNKYKVNNTTLEFTETEILTMVENTPEKFSPNVILRPLYQETILPNLAYIGGGGEIAYWLELKSMFEAFTIPFPIVLLRNSVLIASEKQAKKADNLELQWKDLFSQQNELLKRKTKEFSQFEIDFTDQKSTLKQQFEKLEQMASQTDKSFTGAVKAQLAKQIKGLENLEKRLLKAEKRIHADKLERITLLQNELFPNKSLQERQLNFAEFYIEYGDDFFTKLLQELQPLENQFTIITL